MSTSGTPRGWSTARPEHRPLARHDSIATRSRKGRTSLRVVKRAEHLFTTGDAHYIDQVVDMVATVDLGELTERQREHQLVRKADALLSQAGLLDRTTRLTDRPWLAGKAGQCAPMVVDGGAIPTGHRKPDRETKSGKLIRGAAYRGSRGAEAWSIAVPEDLRAEFWCEFCERSADRCQHAISVPASVGLVTDRNGSSQYQDNATSIADRWITRQSYPSNRVAPIGTVLIAEVPIAEGSGRTRKVHGRRHGHLVELVAYGPHGAWVGHQRANHQDTRAARQARSQARQTLASQRDDITRSVLQALATWTEPVDINGATITVETLTRTRQYTATINGVKHTARTPAALATKVASLIAA